MRKVYLRRGFSFSKQGMVEMDLVPYLPTLLKKVCIVGDSRNRGWPLEIESRGDNCLV